MLQNNEYYVFMVEYPMWEQIEQQRGYMTEKNHYGATQKFKQNQKTDPVLKMYRNSIKHVLFLNGTGNGSLVCQSLNLNNFQVGNFMGKKSERFAKVYREFTRVKFNKYRLQYPKVRQSELIAKILKEWEAMDEDAKQTLQAQYIERSGRGFLDDESDSDKKKDQQKKAEKAESVPSAEPGTKKIQKKKKKPSPKVRVFKEKSGAKKMSPEELGDYRPGELEDSKSPGKKSTPDKKSSTSELAIQTAKSGGKVPESKPKSKAEDYHTFFKYYHDRLNAEHPRWTSLQISTIIKLLWKKRNLKDPKKKKRIIKRVLSGRQFYTRTKLSEGFPKEQIRQLWRALPFESKKYWQIQGQGKPHRSKKNSGSFVRKVLNSGANSKDAALKDNDSGLGWMNHQIK